MPILIETFGPGKKVVNCIDSEFDKEKYPLFNYNKVDNQMYRQQRVVDLISKACGVDIKEKHKCVMLSILLEDSVQENEESE